MARIRCAALECIHNHGCSCSRRYVRMTTEIINGRTMLRCESYERSVEILQLLTILGSNPKLSAEKEKL